MGFNLTSYDRRDTNPGLFDTPDFDGQARLVDYVANILLAECNIFSVGVDYLQEEATSTFAPLVGQYNSGVWVQDEVRLADRWFATAGFRWDDHSSAGQAETYRFTNLIRLKETGTDVHSTIATGFRAPALAESKVTFGFGANPDLRPEQVRGIDVGATQTFCGGKFVLDGTYYRNRFRNLIQFDFPTFRLENIGSARASGVEVTGTWIMECCTTISAGYTLTDTINLETGEELARRPRHKANLVLSHDLLAGNGRVNLYFYYVGDRLDFAGGPTLEDYVLVNLSSSLRLTPCCELFVRMDNVLDQDYHEAGGFGTPGINGFGGVNLVW
jgi:vitamin B12 transporter